MLLRRTLHLLSPSERQVLRSQWLGSGQCLRCFHKSVCRRAQDGTHESTDAYNAPKRGPTRQQRSAMISEEVKMLQRDHPSPSFGEPDPNTLRPPGASQTVDPEAIGENVRPGRMGENDGALREGPMAQGVGSPIRADENMRDSSIQARGARILDDASKGPAEGGASVLGAASVTTHQQNTTRASKHDEKNDMDDNDKSRTKQFAPTTTSVQVEPASRDELLHRKYSPATIAGGDYTSVIEDRMKFIAEPGQGEHRDPRYLAHKMRQGQFVRFISKEEKAAVEDIAKEMAAKRAGQVAREKKLGNDDVQPAPTNYEFRPLPPGARRGMVEKMVAGQYDPDGVLQQGGGKPMFSNQPVLNTVAKMTLKNDSYLSGDGKRLLKKVQSLLPAARVQQGVASQRQKA